MNFVEQLYLPTETKPRRDLREMQRCATLPTDTKTWPKDLEVFNRPVSKATPS